MSGGTIRLMRLLVFYDLPVANIKDRKIYSKFRKFLLNDGYEMLQFSVYERMTNGMDAIDKHMARLEKNLPLKGSIRCLVITEKQYVGMKILVGQKSFQEKTVGKLPLLYF
jgi:CRISPR-associated protein Cas2